MRMTSTTVLRMGSSRMMATVWDTNNTKIKVLTQTWCSNSSNKWATQWWEEVNNSIKIKTKTKETYTEFVAMPGWWRTLQWERTLRCFEWKVCVQPRMVGRGLLRAAMPKQLQRGQRRWASWWLHWRCVRVSTSMGRWRLWYVSFVFSFPFCSHFLFFLGSFFFESVWNVVWSCWFHFFCVVVLLSLLLCRPLTVSSLLSCPSYSCSCCSCCSFSFFCFFVFCFCRHTDRDSDWFALRSRLSRWLWARGGVWRFQLEILGANLSQGGMDDRSYLQLGHTKDRTESSVGAQRSKFAGTSSSKRWIGASNGRTRLLSFLCKNLRIEMFLRSSKASRYGA